MFASHQNVCVALPRLAALQPLRYYGRECNLREEMAMTRAYHVVGADGHILEPSIVSPTRTGR